MTIPNGDPLHLKCKVGGYPLPKTTWYIDGTPLKNIPPYEIASRGGESSLRIPQTEENDGGVYSCLATNPSGQDTTSSNVTVEGRHILLLLYSQCVYIVMYRSSLLTALTHQLLFPIVTLISINIPLLLLI